MAFREECIPPPRGESGTITDGAVFGTPYRVLVANMAGAFRRLLMVCLACLVGAKVRLSPVLNVAALPTGEKVQTTLSSAKKVKKKTAKLRVPVEAWRDVFDELDANNDGALSFSETTVFVDRIAPASPLTEHLRNTFGK